MPNKPISWIVIATSAGILRAPSCLAQANTATLPSTIMGTIAGRHPAATWPLPPPTSTPPAPPAGLPPNIGDTCAGGDMPIGATGGMPIGIIPEGGDSCAGANQLPFATDIPSISARLMTAKQRVAGLQMQKLNALNVGSDTTELATKLQAAKLCVQQLKLARANAMMMQTSTPGQEPAADTSFTSPSFSAGPAQDFNPNSQ